MKIKMAWNAVGDGLFSFDNETELFSVERAKERKFYFSKIRRNICVAVRNKNRNVKTYYTNPTSFEL